MSIVVLLDSGDRVRVGEAGFPWPGPAGPSYLGQRSAVVKGHPGLLSRRRRRRSQPVPSRTLQALLDGGPQLLHLLLHQRVAEQALKKLPESFRVWSVFRRWVGGGGGGARFGPALERATCGRHVRSRLVRAGDEERAWRRVRGAPWPGVRPPDDHREHGPVPLEQHAIRLDRRQAVAAVTLRLAQGDDTDVTARLV